MPGEAWWLGELKRTRGHVLRDHRYADGVSVMDEPYRACVHCGRQPIPHIRQGMRMWDDACIDDLRTELPFLVYDACCGHGDSGAARIRILGDAADLDYKGVEALSVMRQLGGSPCPET